MRLSKLLLAAGIVCSLQSCEFSCSVGNNEKGENRAVTIRDGARIYNNIQLNTNGIRVDKAYLFLESGERVPDNNMVDFTETIKLQLKFASDWTEENGRVYLGASEKIVSEAGDVILEEDDLFAKYTTGIDAKDAKSVYLSAIIKLKEGSLPTSFKVLFKVWDKKSDKLVEGNYTVYSK